MAYKSKIDAQAYAKEHYQNNKVYYKTKSIKHKNKIRDLIRARKNTPCVDCGKSYPYYVMDFDHRDAAHKKFTIGLVVTSGAIRKIEGEIEKCDVVCANCHRQRSFNRRK